MAGSDGGLQLYLKHRAALVEYARPLVGCEARAEDIVQDAYLRFAPAAARDELRSPLSYLYHVVRNLALDRRRSMAVEARRTDGRGLTEDIPAAAVGPEQTLIDRQALRAVSEALDELPPRTREAFDLYRFGGLTLAETARRLGISTTLTHQFVHAAMTHCADRLAALESEKTEVVIRLRLEAKAR